MLVSSIVVGEITAVPEGGAVKYSRQITVTEIGGASVSISCRSAFKKDLAVRRKQPKDESSNEWLEPKLYQPADE
jgi:hypothetical protein